MSELTKNQQDIIDLLTTEFNKINGIKTTSTSGLIDVESIISEYTIKMNTINEVKLNNKQWIEVFKETAINDFNLLKPDMDILGLQLEIIENGLCLVIGNNFHDYRIKIRYNPEYVLDKIGGVSKTIGVLKCCYLSSLYDMRVKTLVDITSHLTFKNNLKRLYEISKKAE